MPTKETNIEELKQASDEAELKFKNAMKAVRVARAAMTEAAKEAARARMKYNRAIGAQLEEDDDDSA
jgi:hypothetical protein